MELSRQTSRNSSENTVEAEPTTVRKSPGPKTTRNAMFQSTDAPFFWGGGN